MIEDFLSLSFDHSERLWLLMTVPVLVALSWRALAALDPVQRWSALLTRCLVIILVVLCLAGIEHVRTNDNLTVLFLVDRSNSIPKDRYIEQEQYAFEISKKAPPDDKIGVLTFDGQSYIEQLPMRGGVFLDTFSETSLPDRTDLAGAIRMALALFPHDTAKRIVIVSDGNNNIGDALAEAETASAQGVGIDVLPMYYLYNREVFIEKLSAPASAKDGDLVLLRAIVISKRPMSGTFSLTHNGKPVLLSDDIARQTLRAGQNLFSIKMPIHGSGSHSFELVFRPDNEDADTIVENNRATAFTMVGGTERALLLTTDIENDAELVRALQKEKIEIDAVKIEDAENISLTGFMQYSTIILANVGASWFTDAQQADLATYVRDMGRGLIMTGGDEAFGAGGWIGTPIEKIMPVDFEIKHRQVIPRGALVIIMHSCEMPRGNYWGRRVAAKAVDTISSKDYFGMLGYSHMRGVTWEVPLQVAINKTAIKSAINKMSNGDMPDFSSTMKMAVEGLMELKDAAQRHMIIISDGDAQPPMQSTIDLMKEKKITCSTVAIGYGRHVMMAPMRRIAKQTGGRFYAARNPKKLPQIFAKESKVVRRPLIVEQPFTPRLVYTLSDLWAGFPLDMEIPQLGGLVMTSPKEGGMVEMPLARTTSDGDDPVLAHWQVGLGKTVAFTSGYWQHWGRNWTDWDKFGKLWAQIVRWTMGQGAEGNFDIHVREEGDKARIILNALDLDSNYINGLDLIASVAKPGGMGVEQVRYTQVGPGRYEATFPLDYTGQYVVNTTRIDGGKTVGVGHTGLSVPYSPEYKELRANEALLQRIVDISGGKLLEHDVENDDVFRHDLPPTKSHQPVWDWILAWLLLPVFLFDVALRRLASRLALSVFVEVLIDVVLLWGLGLIYLPQWEGVFGTIGVIIFGELVGWSIRYRSIRPAIEFLTHSMESLRGAGQASAASLEQLKGTRDRVREERTAEGLGEKVVKLPRGAHKTRVDAGQKFEAGDRTDRSASTEEMLEQLGAPSPSARDQGKPEVFTEQQKDERAAQYTSRLLKARRRAKDEIERQGKKEDGNE